MERDENERERRVDRLRRLARPVAFEAGFSDRVMARLDRQPSLADGMQWMFFRLAPLAAAAALILATSNVMSTRGSGQPFLDRLVGLQTVSLAAAYTLESDVVWTTGIPQ